MDAHPGGRLVDQRGDLPGRVRRALGAEADQLEQLHEEAGPGIGFIVEVKHRMPGLVIDLCEKVVPIPNDPTASRRFACTHEATLCHPATTLSC